ncbi:AlbA family DNA-binding domain-containing protein [Miltoncostaea oceani]|uniref:AlbA family DNA-binding domain-containing protein n=1 Tax=Miltoncostaea oceani TaxID=2843216 RepID=UPI001C3DF9EC|nr:ATP-binding protein [Miltoncostaea oceani]
MASVTDPVDLWTAEHIRLLVDQELPEGARLEYKRELHLRQAKQRVEAAKDLSGLSNADGGVLVYGIEEQPGADGFMIPVGVCPLTDGTLPDRLRDVISGICQPVPHYEMRRVDVDGGYCLVLRVPVAPAPIMISAGDRENRYYRRHGTQVLAMGEREVREAYERLGSSRDAIERLHREAQPLQELPHADAKVFADSGWGFRPPPWLSVVFTPLLAPAEVLRPSELAGLDLAEADPFFGDGVLRPCSFGLETSWEAGGVVYAQVRAHRNGVVQFASLQESRRDYYLHRRGRGPLEDFIAAEEVRLALRAFDLAELLFRRAGYHGPVAVDSRIRYIAGAPPGRPRKPSRGHHRCAGGERAI